MNEALKAAAARCVALRQEIGGETAGVAMLKATETTLEQLWAQESGGPLPEGARLFGLSGGGAETAARVLRGASPEEAAKIVDTCFAVWKLAGMGMVKSKDSE